MGSCKEPPIDGHNHAAVQALIDCAEAADEQCAMFGDRCTAARASASARAARGLRRFHPSLRTKPRWLRWR
jgi:hypothetical protein